jgi:hypothetical protein
VKNAKIGAKKDFFTEKRHFPMDFFHDTFNHSIPFIHQQITIMKSVMYWIKKWVIKLNSPPTSRTHMNPATNPTQNSIIVFVPPNGQVMVNFFETFRKSCGELAEQVRTLRNGIGAI